MTWLNRLFEWLRDFFPVLWIVQPDAAGIITTLGTKVKKVGPGWYIRWPLIHDLQYFTTSPDTIDLRIQSLVTSDGQDVIVGGAFRRRVVNAEAAALKVDNLDTSLATTALGVIGRYVATVEFKILIAGTKLLERELKEELKKEARGMGVEIMRVYITDIGRAKNYRVAGGGGAGVAPIGEGE